MQSLLGVDECSYSDAHNKTLSVCEKRRLSASLTVISVFDTLIGCLAGVLSLTHMREPLLMLRLTFLGHTLAST